MSSVIALFVNKDEFMEEITRKSRACTGRKRDKVLLLGGAYLNTYLRLEAKDSVIPEEFLQNPEVLVGLMEAGKLYLQNLRVQVVDGDVFAVRHKDEKYDVQELL